MNSGVSSGKITANYPNMSHMIVLVYGVRVRVNYFVYSFSVSFVSFFFFASTIYATDWTYGKREEFLFERKSLFYGTSVYFIWRNIPAFTSLLSCYFYSVKNYGLSECTCMCPLINAAATQRHPQNRNTNSNRNSLFTFDWSDRDERQLHKHICHHIDLPSHSITRRIQKRLLHHCHHR